MEVLSNNTILVFDDEHTELVNTVEGLPLAAKPGHEIGSYRELLRKVAALNFHNPRFKLLFRGQTEDYRLNMLGEPGAHSHLYPSILRAKPGQKKDKSILDHRFVTLQKADELLRLESDNYHYHQNQIVRWALLQHYEVCDTPLLDVTGSLQTALSFALYPKRDQGYVYVLAFPQLSGPLSVSIESKTQVIDLSQLCPPDVLRPHFQSGMLVGDYPIVDHRKASHGGKGMIGNNFACRLLTKFQIRNCLAWQAEGFTPTPDSILRPNAEDRWFQTLRSIKSRL
jgi:hypothetical protein